MCFLIKLFFTGFPIFIFLILDSYTQELTRGIADYEIIYSYTIDRSGLEESDKDIPPNLRRMFLAAEEIASKLQGRLIFNNNSSIYWSPEGVVKNNQEDAFANILVNADHKFYYYQAEDILYIEKLEYGSKSQYIDDKTIIWEILPDQTIINGLICRKAIGTFKTEGWNDTKVEVWFAPDLPLPFGPVAANGLPGVIMKFNWTSLVITARSIKKITNKGEEIVIPDFGDVPSFSERLR